MIPIRIVISVPLLLISLNVLNWPISISNVASAHPEPKAASSKNDLCTLEKDLSRAYDATPESDRSALRALIDSIHGHSLSSKSIKASQIHDDSRFDLIAKGLMKSLNKNGPLVIASKPGQDNHGQTLFKYVIDYLNAKVGNHCKSFMDSGIMSSLYADFLSQVAKDPKLQLKDWKLNSIAAISIANVCHYVEANPMELYLLGSFDHQKLVDKLFAKKETSEAKPKDAEISTDSTALPPDHVEGLLKTFMLIQDAYEEMFKEQSGFEEYEDLAGFAQIIGDVNEEKCFSGYINSLTQVLDNFSKYVHLETYLHTRMLQQAQLCAKQLEFIVREEYNKQDNADFEKSIRVLRKEIEKAADLGATEEKDPEQRHIPLYISIPEEVFFRGFTSFLEKVSKDVASSIKNHEQEEAKLSEMTEGEVMQLIGNSSIKMVDTLGPMLIFSFDLVALIEDLGVHTDTIIDQSTLDIMTEVNICERILKITTE